MPAELPAGVIQARYAPFGQLLPQAAALVHHGGVGSAQALRAGIPQLVLPVGYDQFDNALRLELLGVAATVQPPHQNPTCMAAPLVALLGKPAVAQACRSAAARMAQNGAMATVYQVIEAAQ
jgi:UDP:flavonoid glycosyltransferase YjiC (YdhE family)